MARVTTNLRLYQKSLRQAKAAQRLHFQSAKVKQLVEEYERYQREYYKISKNLRQAGVKLSQGHGQGLWIPKHVEHYSARSEVMSISQYNRYSQRYSDLTAEQIALKQYNLISKDIAQTLQQALRKNGLGEYSLEVIRARQLPEDVWIKMQEIAEKKNSTISEFFYGSD